MYIKVSEILYCVFDYEVHSFEKHDTCLLATGRYSKHGLPYYSLSEPLIQQPFAASTHHLLPS